MQAPQSPISETALVPVRPSSSRRTSSSVRSGSTATDLEIALTSRWTTRWVVVDDDVDVHDETAVWRAVFEHCDFLRDIEVVNGPLDILDHAAPRLGAGHKIGLDATRKIPGEEVNGHPVRDYPDILKMDKAIVELVEKRWGEYGL